MEFDFVGCYLGGREVLRVVDFVHLSGSVYVALMFVVLLDVAHKIDCSLVYLVESANDLS